MDSDLLKQESNFRKWLVETVSNRKKTSNGLKWFPVDENVDPLEKGLLYPVRTTSAL
ncbi:MAG: hypothetical protein WAJ93_18060 [Candidatus Nitrosopolaris sp.]